MQNLVLKQEGLSNITLFLFQETVALPTTKKQSKGFQTSEKVACLDFLPQIN